MGLPKIAGTLKQIITDAIVGETSRMALRSRLRLVDAVCRFRSDCDAIAEDDCDFRSSGLREYIETLLSAI